MKNKYIYRFFAILTIISTLSFTSFAQDTTFAREALRKLCSSDFAGRAYVDDGDKKAANYISESFKNFGIHAITENYQQPFDIKINTIPSISYFIIDEDTLVPAVDYYISNASSGISGEYELKFINDSLFHNNKDYIQNLLMLDLSDKILVFESSKSEFRFKFKTEIGGLIFLHDNDIGYWSYRGAQEPVNYAIIDMLDSLLPEHTKSIKIKFRNKFHASYTTQNVIGYVLGKTYPDTFIAITAHYDHMGKMGENVYFPGANDNASGTVMMMDLAKYFSDSLNQPDYSIVFMAFSGEEVGLLGSQHYVRNPLFKLDKIKMLINLDMVGTGSDGIKIVNGSIYKKEFNKIRKINAKNKYLKAVNSRGESCNSDHCPFYKMGVPSFFIYTLGDEYKEYHNINDKAENLPLTKYPELFKLMRDYIIEF
ncbi:MAG: Zn-dependent exopeptidase M28 [Bacteroidales bacterium]|nr:Zn-dependent exopeptidase M28 [Bacteroidales bacterium]